MKFRVLIAALLSIALQPLTLFAAEKPKTQLGEQMSAMNKTFRKLRGELKAGGKKESTLELIAAMKKNATRAKELAPEKAKEIPEPERPNFIAEYQKRIDDLLADFTKIEDAIGAGHSDEAAKLLDHVQALKRKGHEQFSSEDDK